MPMIDQHTIAMKRRVADQCVQRFDSAFFKAMCEPARLAVLREVMVLGRGDIESIAAELPQDRSVVARHLKVLADVGVVRSAKQGRHVFYELDADGVRARMEGLQELVDMVRSITATPA